MTIKFEYLRSLQRFIIESEGGELPARYGRFNFNDDFLITQEPYAPNGPRNSIILNPSGTFLTDLLETAVSRSINPDIGQLAFEDDLDRSGVEDWDQHSVVEPSIKRQTISGHPGVQSITPISQSWISLSPTKEPSMRASDLSRVSALIRRKGSGTEKTMIGVTNNRKPYDYLGDGGVSDRVSGTMNDAQLCLDYEELLPSTAVTKSDYDITEVDNGGTLLGSFSVTGSTKHQYTHIGGRRYIDGTGLESYAHPVGLFDGVDNSLGYEGAGGEAAWSFLHSYNFDVTFLVRGMRYSNNECLFRTVTTESGIGLLVTFDGQSAKVSIYGGAVVATDPVLEQGRPYVFRIYADNCSLVIEVYDSNARLVTTSATALFGDADTSDPETKLIIGNGTDLSGSYNNFHGNINMAAMWDRTLTGAEFGDLLEYTTNRLHDTWDNVLKATAGGGFVIWPQTGEVKTFDTSSYRLADCSGNGHHGDISEDVAETVLESGSYNNTIGIVCNQTSASYVVMSSGSRDWEQDSNHHLFVHHHPAQVATRGYLMSQADPASSVRLGFGVNDYTGNPILPYANSIVNPATTYMGSTQYRQHLLEFVCNDTTSQIQVSADNTVLATNNYSSGTGFSNKVALFATPQGTSQFYTGTVGAMVYCPRVVTGSLLEDVRNDIDKLANPTEEVRFIGFETDPSTSAMWCVASSSLSATIAHPSTTDQWEKFELRFDQTNNQVNYYINNTYIASQDDVTLDYGCHPVLFTSSSNSLFLSRSLDVDYLSYYTKEVPR